MKKSAKAKPQPDIVSSTLRLPRDLWARLNHIRIDERRSMQLSIIIAIEQYCERMEKGKKS